MMCGNFPLAKNLSAPRFVLGAVFMCLAASLPVLATPQADSDIPPDATPQIQQVNPNQASAGAHVTITIQGSNFSASAYVSSVSAALHVDSTKRVSATQIEAQLSVSASAQPSTVSLLVSNPASRAAETAFKIVAGQTTNAPAKESVEPPASAASLISPAPSAPAAPASPALPAQEVKPSGPLAPVAPPAPPPRSGSNDDRAPPRGPGLRCGFENHRKEFCPRYQSGLCQPENPGDGGYFHFGHRAYGAHQGCERRHPGRRKCVCD